MGEVAAVEEVRGRPCLRAPRPGEPGSCRVPSARATEATIPCAEKQPGTAEHRVNSELCSNHDTFCPPNPPGRVRERMEPESSRGLLQLPTEARLPTEGELPPGEKKKYLAPASRKDPRFEELQQVLMEWINATLLPEHIVARSLEEDLFDGLILHHLFQKLAALRLEVEEMALTSASQQRKLAVVLDAVNRSLQVEERQVPWSVEAIFSKDLLATLHLLVALAKRFQPDLPLPANVHVEVITIESTRTGLKSETSVEQLTECGADKDGLLVSARITQGALLHAPALLHALTVHGRMKKDAGSRPPTPAPGGLQLFTGSGSAGDVFDELFKLAPEKVKAVSEAIMTFVNQKLERLGLSVQNLDTQFADGVILLLLIGQLQGFFLHLKEFYLTPSSPAERLHNVTLALELLRDHGLLQQPVSPEAIVNKDARSTLRLLYCLFRKHKLEAPHGAPR
ncbi:gamma-parvin [Lepus europaeus]|uniref:gamma-parvin n=1 Tax=Lepus europaeus TaxID=9983 RepID=UPI002B466121|nr:gamma-parvin [Lepus europaeus]